MPLVRDELVSLKSGGSDYVFHVPTSSFFELDGDTHRVLNAVGDTPVPDEDIVPLMSNLLEYPNDELNEIVGDLVRLRLLVPPELRGKAEHDPVPPGNSIRNLVLHVAHACNLACGYCYAEQGLYKGRAMIMNQQMANDFVDWLFEQADPSVGALGITFFGGEPLLNFAVVQDTARYALAKAEEAGKRIHFGITTNGTLVTEEIAEFLAEIGAKVTVSLDAIGKANDRLRPFVGGKGSYAEVLERIQPLLERKLAVARVTVTKINLDVVKTVETLLAEGFTEVGCSPVDAKNPAYDLDGNDYKKLLEGFSELTRRFVDEAAKGRHYGFSNIINIVKAIHQGHNKQYPCGAGVQMVAGSPKGTMSLCHRFTGESEYELGSVQTGGLDQERRLKILDEIQLEQRSDCSTCWARYICSGGCHHVNFLFEGDPAKTYLTHCDWLRAWYRTGLVAYADILQRNPTFISQFLDPGWDCRN